MSRIRTGGETTTAARGGVSWAEESDDEWSTGGGGGEGLKACGALRDGTMKEKHHKALTKMQQEEEQALTFHASVKPEEKHVGD